MVSEIDVPEPLEEVDEGNDNVKRVDFTNGSAPDSSTPSGFRARLSGATIADLVQMECLAGSRLAARVSSAGRTGYLFFDAGQLVHAELGSTTGEAAALAILSMSGGDFEATDRSWPASPTIATNWQNLLLRAAQDSDEQTRPAPRSGAHHGESKTMTATRSDEPGVVPLTQRVARAAAEHSRTMPNSTRRPSQREPNESGSPCVPPSGDNELRSLPMLRLDSKGNIIANRGAPEELADIVAYAARLTALIGDELGLDKFRALECQYAEQRCVSFFADNGDLISVLAPSRADLSALKRRLQL